MRNPVEPFFLPSPEGTLFAVHHRPAPAARVRGHMLCIAPFNEEMNRCRSMITQQAQAWASFGIGTLLLDLLGTGDSAGGFDEARWPIWLNNLRQAKAWLDEQPGGCIGLWGIRLGAILGAELHSTLADPRLALILWQPVLDGKVHMTQFMRVKIAAQMDRTDLPKETTGSMRAALSAGRPIEVAGYAMAPELVNAIDASRLSAHPLAAGTRVLWLEHLAPDQSEVSPASRLALAQWPGPDCACSVETFTGPAFWQVHERVLAPQAVERTSAWMAGPQP